MSRRLSALETSLGIRLFERSTDGVVTAEAASALIPRAEAMEQLAQEMGRAFSGLDNRMRGVVRLALPEALGVFGVIPSLGPLRRLYPELQLELLPGTAPVDLTRNEADLAIRLAEPEEGDLIAQEHGTIDFGVFVARRSAWPRRAIAETPWVTWDRTQAGIPSAVWLTQNFPNAEIALRTSTLIGIVAGAQAGVGAALLPRGIAARARGLVEVDVRRPLPSAPVYLVYHRGRRSIARVKVVREFLSQLLAASAAK